MNNLKNANKKYLVKKLYNINYIRLFDYFLLFENLEYMTVSVTILNSVLRKCISNYHIELNFLVRQLSRYLIVREKYSLTKR